jgi:preprotein translocase subunit YajC
MDGSKRVPFSLPITLAKRVRCPKLSGHFHMHLNAFLAQAPAPATTAPAAPAQGTSTAPATTTTTATTGTPSAQTTQQAPFFASPIFLFIVLGVLMYVMLFRPQQQQRKQMAKLLAALKAGDRVATSSGIVGTVITVKDKTVSLRSADAKMEVTKASVTEILESSDSTPSSQ